MKKKKIGIAVAIIFVLVILLFPTRRYYEDGGSVGYKSFVYEIIKIHQLADADGVKPYIDGFEIKLLGMTVYRKTNEAENAKEARVLSSNMEDYRKPEDTVLIELPVDIEYQKISYLKVDCIDKTALIKYDDKLFGKSFLDIDYIGGGEPIGEISKLIDKDLVPHFNGETNNEELVGALVYECGTVSAVLYYDNTYILFELIE